MTPEEIKETVATIRNKLQPVADLLLLAEGDPELLNDATSGFRQAIKLLRELYDAQKSVNIQRKYPVEHKDGRLGEVFNYNFGPENKLKVLWVEDGTFSVVSWEDLKT